MSTHAGALLLAALAYRYARRYAHAAEGEMGYYPLEWGSERSATAMIMKAAQKRTLIVLPPGEISVEDVKAARMLRSAQRRLPSSLVPDQQNTRTIAFARWLLASGDLWSAGRARWVG